MKSYPDITSAAHNRDWQRCAKLMFGLLSQCSPEEQREVARGALTRDLDTFAESHPYLREPVVRLLNRRAGDPGELPEFPDELDAAEAEFENGIIAFYNGIVSESDRSERTANFATAVRSAVTAKQIERWMRDYPRAFAQWKAGLSFEEPTFLEDPAAAGEAENAWIFVDQLLRAQPSLASRPLTHLYRFPRQIGRLYRRWEETVL